MRHKHTWFQGIAKVFRSSFISHVSSKDWTWMSNQAAIEPGWLVDADAPVFNISD